MGKFIPYLTFAEFPPFYTQSLHKNYQGRWGFNLDYKPIPSFATYFGWVSAVLIAQKIVRKSIIETITCVIFHSDKSCFARTWDDRMLSSDAVLDFKDIGFFGRKIYPNTDIVEIKNAMHDVVLSADEAIDDYLQIYQTGLQNILFPQRCAKTSR